MRAEIPLKKIWAQALLAIAHWQAEAKKTNYAFWRRPNFIGGDDGEVLPESLLLYTSMSYDSQIKNVPKVCRSI